MQPTLLCESVLEQVEACVECGRTEPYNLHAFSDPERFILEISETQTARHIKMARVSRDRLWNDIMFTSQWGAMDDKPGGMLRLALTKEDRKVRDWFYVTAQELGCVVKIDQMGNMFATLPGEAADVPPIAIGSHLDTQPAGEHLTTLVIAVPADII